MKEIPLYENNSWPRTPSLLSTRESSAPVKLNQYSKTPIVFKTPPGLRGHGENNTSVKAVAVAAFRLASVLENDQGEVIGAVEVLTYMTSLVQKQQEIESLKHMFHLDDGFNGILGKTPVMETLFQLIVSVAQSDAPVLIQGESGTGKELVALAIHENSPRKKQ